MTLTLTPQIEEAILKKLESGKYVDASDVVGEALKLLEAHEQEERLREALKIGLDQIERGEVVEWTHQTMAELRRRADDEDRLGLPIKADVKP
jgi:antitoxin ParD1/3/4